MEKYLLGKVIKYEKRVQGKIPKIMAFYLPQFHQIPENDEWWGEGFTDWEGAKKAVPLFWGHNQPRIPLHNNYYNLLDKKTMKWQAALAKKYGIYGFCIYHYWFGEKQLLEKPAENLLKWKDIDINYCFSWANESWIASWSKLKGNVWNQHGDEKKTNQNEYLVKQNYGGKEEWKKHFFYLLPFFQDRRYIKINNAPVYIIYKPENMHCLRSFIEYWNCLAKENGFDGIYFVGTNFEKWKEAGMSAMLLYEPSFTLKQEQRGNYNRAFILSRLRDMMKEYGLKFPKLINYNFVWRRILRRKNDGNIWPGGFINFDNTPRKGTYGAVCIGNTPERFHNYFKYLVEKNRQKEFIFLTAWNEWGEGAYMEPDNNYRYTYLQAVADVINHK